MDKWRYHPGVGPCATLRRVGRSARAAHDAYQLVNEHTDVDAVWILAPHDLAIALEILGRLPEPRAAVGERLDGRAVGIHAVLGEDPWAVLEVSVASPSPRREVRLHCDAGVAVLPDAYSDHLQIIRSGAPVERRAVSTEPPLRRELRAFVDHLGGSAAPRSSAADAAAIVCTLEHLRALAGLDGGRA